MFAKPPLHKHSVVAEEATITTFFLLAYLALTTTVFVVVGVEGKVRYGADDIKHELLVLTLKGTCQ